MTRPAGEFSQYPGEREYLWNPCSLLEPAGEERVEATSEGIVTIIPVCMKSRFFMTATADYLPTLSDEWEDACRGPVAGTEIRCSEFSCVLGRYG